MRAVVVDASVAVKWLVQEEHTEEAEELLRAWVDAGVPLAAPHFLPFEVANVLHKKSRRGELSVGDCVRQILQLLDTPFQLHQSALLHVRALELARQLQQGAVYDSHYLALAEQLDCELWTADQRFHRATQGAWNVRLLGDWVPSR